MHPSQNNLYITHPFHPHNYGKMKRNPSATMMRERKSITYHFSLKRIIKHHESDAYNYALKEQTAGV